MSSIRFVTTFVYGQPSALPGLSERQHIEQAIRDDLWEASDSQKYWPLHEPRVRSFENSSEWVIEFGGRLYISDPEKISNSMAVRQLIENIPRLSRLLSDQFKYRSVIYLP